MKSDVAQRQRWRVGFEVSYASESVIAILRNTKTDTQDEGPDIGVKVPARFQFSSFDGRLGWAPGTTERCWL